MDEEVKKEPQSNELEDLKAKSNEYLNNWKRSAADFINYKMDEMERMQMLTKYAKEDVLYKVLSVFDSFYLAQKHSNILQNVGMTEWQKGFEQIQNQIKDFLKKEGIEEIEVIGKPFDPNCMEIVSEEEGGESGIVTEELQKGYNLGEKVLRPAKVKVSK